MPHIDRPRRFHTHPFDNVKAVSRGYIKKLRQAAAIETDPEAKRALLARAAEAEALLPRGYVK